MFAFHRFFDFCVAVFSGRAVFWGGGWERAMRGVLVGAVMAVVGGGTVAYAGDCTHIEGVHVGYSGYDPGAYVAGDYEPGSCHEETVNDTVINKVDRIFGLEDFWCWGESDYSKEKCETVVQPCLRWVGKYCDDACLKVAYGMDSSDEDDEIELFINPEKIEL